MMYSFEMGSGANYIHTKFRKDWFRHSLVIRRGYTYRHVDTQTAR
jgi:hypothetical protein